MPPCCSSQSGLAAPEHRKWRRVHGLQLPLHPQQIAGWIALIFYAGSSFFVLIPAFSSSFRLLLTYTIASLFALHIIAHLTALLLDPADSELRRLKPAKSVVPEFDRSKHAHVIENGRCHLCNIETSGPRTKHCSVCNKCVGKFDHHCKWLNHCIGRRNYAAFLVCVVSAVVACAVIVGIAVTELVFYHVDPSWLEYPWSSDYSLPPELFLIVVGLVAVLAAVTAGLLLHLCLFHVYISILGITTYEYIRNYRNLSVANQRTLQTQQINRRVYHNQHGLKDSKSVNSDDSFLFLNKVWKKNDQNRTDLEAGDRTCSVETVESTLRRSRSFQEPRYANNRHYFTSDLNGADIRGARNGFGDKNFSASSVAFGETNHDRRICRSGCKYCAKSNEPRNDGYLGCVCSDGRIRDKESLNDAGVVTPPPAPRRNQIQPTSSRIPKRSTSLPALPPPARRQMQNGALKELDDVLAYVQRNPQIPQPPSAPAVARRTPPRRYVGRKSIPTLRPTMSPTLSPIHESGLSNPGTPQPAPKPRRGVWLSPNRFRSAT